MRIGAIETDDRIVVVAEIGNNHEGNPERARELVRRAAECGVDAVKVQLLPTADAATHVSQVRVTLPDVPEATPGMFARVHFVTGRADKLTVPAAAVVRRGEVAAVYLQLPDGRLSLRQLRLGDAVGQGEIEVLAGLAAGDRVVTDPVRAAIALKAAVTKSAPEK